MLLEWESSLKLLCTAWSSHVAHSSVDSVCHVFSTSVSLSVCVCVYLLFAIIICAICAYSFVLVLSLTWPNFSQVRRTILLRYKTHVAAAVYETILWHLTWLHRESLQDCCVDMSFSLFWVRTWSDPARRLPQNTRISEEKKLLNVCIAEPAVCLSQKVEHNHMIWTEAFIQRCPLVLSTIILAQIHTHTSVESFIWI